MEDTDMIRTFARAAIFSAALVGCSLLPAQQQANINSFLSQLANTSLADLNQTIAIAQAATPPDTDGVTCAQALLTERANVVALYQAAAPNGSVANVGAFSTAELATIFIPGSAQTQAALQTLRTGCAAKIADVQQNVLVGSTQFFGIIAAFANLAPAVP
jgi:hypothetical protein